MYDQFKKKLLAIELPVFILRYIMFEYLIRANEEIIVHIYSLYADSFINQDAESYLIVNKDLNDSH